MLGTSRPIFQKKARTAKLFHASLKASYLFPPNQAISLSGNSQKKLGILGESDVRRFRGALEPGRLKINEPRPARFGFAFYTSSLKLFASK